MPHVKAASPADYGKAASLLETIRQEHPEHWPHGLSPDMFDDGDLFLIRKSASADPVGFVGWQEREMGGQRVGLYSIGVLPSYRHQGIAKEAVSRVLCDRARGVDRVAALVAPGNLPSEKLAEALGVPLLKSAGLGNLISKYPNLSSLVGGLLGGGATAGVYDQFMPHAEGVGLMGSPSRRAAFLTNFATGALGTGGLLKSKWAPTSFFSPGKAQSMAYTGILGIPAVKVWLGQQGVGLEQNERHHADEMKMRAQELATSAAGKVKETGEQIQQAVQGTDWKTLAAGALVASALGGGAYALQKAMKEPQPQTGRMRVTLPTKNPGDAETMIDLPFDQSQALSNNLKSRLELDTRRRLYAETQERIRRRKGQPGPAFPNLESKVPQLQNAAL